MVSFQVLLLKNWWDAKMCCISYLKGSDRSVIVNNLFLNFFLILKAKYEALIVRIFQ